MANKPHVLVVDDDEQLCALVRATLELEGIEVRDARHAIEAEKMILQRVPDAARAINSGRRPSFLAQLIASLSQLLSLPAVCRPPSRHATCASRTAPVSCVDRGRGVA